MRRSRYTPVAVGERKCTRCVPRQSSKNPFPGSMLVSFSGKRQKLSAFNCRKRCSFFGNGSNYPTLSWGKGFYRFEVIEVLIFSRNVRQHRLAEAYLFRTGCFFLCPSCTWIRIKSHDVFRIFSPAFIWVLSKILMKKVGLAR